MSDLSPLGPRAASDLGAPAVGPSPGPEVLIPDVCVGVKWYVPVVDSAAASRLLDLRFALHVPDDFFTEAASVSRHKVTVEHSLTKGEALEVYRLLRTVPMIVHATDPRLEEAIRLGDRYWRPVSDSLDPILAASLGRVWQ